MSKVNHMCQNISFVVSGIGIMSLAGMLATSLIIPGIFITASGIYLCMSDIKQETFWRDIGLEKNDKIPVCIKSIKNDIGEQKVYHLPAGVSFEDIEDKKYEIENALKKNIQIKKANNFNLILTTFTKKLGSNYKFDGNVNKTMMFNAGYSQDINGESMQVINLNSNDCHMLIAGCTGSGKSEFLRHLIVQGVLQSNGDSRKLEFRISDLKGGVTTKIFSRLSNCTKYTIFSDETKIMMQELQEEMMNRYVELNNANCVDYKEYNKRFKDKYMHPIMFIIEEYSLLFNDKEASELLFILLNLARAANISIILTIQRPDFKTLDTRIKANLRTTVCFKTKFDVDSEIVLGHGNYKASRELKTSPPGRGILNDADHDDVIFQSLFMSTNDIERELRGFLVKPPTFTTYEKQSEEYIKSTERDIEAIGTLI